MKVERLTLGICDAHCYILKDERSRQCAVIDPGAADERVLQAVTGWNVAHILLTHGHFDHVEGCWKLSEATRVTARIHPLEKEQPRYLTGGPIRADFDLEDGLELGLGEERILVRHIPGHSPGSLCFYTGEHLFCGDSMLRGGVGRLDLPGGNEKALRKSLEWFKTLPDSVKVWPGHGEESTIGWEKAHNSWLGGEK